MTIGTSMEISWSRCVTLDLWVNVFALWFLTLCRSLHCFHLSLHKQHPLTGYRHEISSMGIRVDRESLLAQLVARDMMYEADLDFFKAVLEERVPYSYGGGLGISRLLMLLLRTGHIGEVQVGLWHDAHYRQAAEAGIDLIPDRIMEVDIAS